MNLKFSWFSSLRLFLKLVGSLFVLFTDFIELLHVLEEIGRSLEGDEKLCLLAVASVVGGLDCDSLGSDLLECGIVVPKSQNIIRTTVRKLDTFPGIRPPIKFSATSHDTAFN